VWAAFAAMASAGMQRSAQASRPSGGIAILPTKSSARWIDDGNKLSSSAEEPGYNGTDLQILPRTNISDQLLPGVEKNIGEPGAPPKAMVDPAIGRTRSPAGSSRANGRRPSTRA